MKVAFAFFLLAASRFSQVPGPSLQTSENPPANQAVAPSTNRDLATARNLLARSELAEAEKSVRHYIAQHPNVSDGHFLLGLILFREVQSLARSSSSYFSPGDLPSTAIDAQSREKKIRASLDAFTEGAKSGKPSADDLKIVALDYVLLEDYADADKWLSLALEWNPRDSEGWYYLGRIKYGENRFEEAIIAFQKCLELRPNYILAMNGVGLSYAGLNKNAEAISWLQKAISFENGAAQKTPEPYIDLGDLLGQQARFEEALSVLQEAVAIDPKNIRAHEKLGKTYLSLDRLTDSEHELKTAISLDPGQARFHYLLSQVYRKLGRLESAKSELAQFEALKAKEPPRKPGMQSILRFVEDH